MPRMKKLEKEDKKPFRSSASFSVLMAMVPVEPFRAMVAKSGLPYVEAARLNQLFRELK